MTSEPQHIESASPVATDGLVSQHVPGRDPADCVWDLERQLTSIRRALDSRDTIGMAKGILMARQNCTPEGAFEMLKKASQRSNRKVADIAAEIVQSNDRRRAATGGAPPPAA